MVKISKVIKALIVLWFMEVTVLSFVILYGLENGFLMNVYDVLLKNIV